ncbi:hypothetical protein [Kamptonema formosum]|nr:hypothetical protein [Oscillatoria sp. PCC 10802]
MATAIAFKFLACKQRVLPQALFLKTPAFKEWGGNMPAVPVNSW